MKVKFLNDGDESEGYIWSRLNLEAENPEDTEVIGKIDEVSHYIRLRMHGDKNHHEVLEISIPLKKVVK
jgi:hypothetical protein